MYDTYLDENIYGVNNSLYEKIKKIKKSNKVFEKVKRIQEYSFVSLYDELILMIRLFQIIGSFPIGRDRTGKLNTNAYSPMAIHCILMFIASSGLAYLTLNDTFKVLHTVTLRFDEKILHFAIMTFMMIHFLQIFIFLERKKIAKHFENWDSFQAEFKKITRKPLIIKARKKQKMLIIYLILIFSSFLFFLYKTAEARYTKLGLKKYSYYTLIFSYAYYGFSLHFCAFFWYFLTNALCQASTSILNYFQECKDKGEFSSDAPLLWLRLKELCCELGEACSYTYLFILLYMFVVDMLIGYSALANFGTDSYSASGYFRFALFFVGFLMLSIIPGLAHQATKKVGDDILNFVTRWGMEEKNPLVARRLRRMAEGIVLKKPEISLAGYVVLNRSMNVSVSEVERDAKRI